MYAMYKKLKFLGEVSKYVCYVQEVEVLGEGSKYVCYVQ